MRRGFIKTAVFFIILGLLGWYFYTKKAQDPSTATQKTAASIPRYPNSASWSMQNKKGVCVVPNQECQRPALIVFDSEDGWADIYHYYLENLKARGWKTNSLILTNIPESITFQNERNCIVHAGKDTGKFFGLVSPKEKTNFISVTCYNSKPPQY